MKTTIQYKEQFIQVDLSKPIDISIPLTNTDENPIAWYIDKPIIEPVVFGDWMGSVSKGKSQAPKIYLVRLAIIGLIALAEICKRDGCALQIIDGIRGFTFFCGFICNHPRTG